MKTIISFNKYFENKYFENTKYKLGDKYKDDFDYTGMLNMCLTVNLNWSIKKLNKLHDSLEDTDYHVIGRCLTKLIKSITDKSENSEKILKEFHNLVEKEKQE